VLSGQLKHHNHKHTDPV